jgi:hypothetical protein
MALLDAPASVLSDDRVVNLPNLTTSVDAMISTTLTIAVRRGITLGPITDTPDETVRAIVGSWPTGMDASRALALGCPADENLGAVIETFIDDYV